MFVLNSGYDSWQTNFIWFTPHGGKPIDPGWAECAQYINRCNSSQLELMELFHSRLVAKLAPMTDQSTPHGGFVESCMQHCQGFPTGISYNNLSAYMTLAKWYDNKILAKTVDHPYLSGQGACKPSKTVPAYSPNHEHGAKEA